MRKTLAVSLLLCCLLWGSAVMAGDSWSLISAQDNPSVLDVIKFYDVHFMDMTTGIAVGSNGLYGAGIFKTADGGVTWEVKHQLAMFQMLEGLSFADENNGWAVGYHGTNKKTNFILHTTDGGETWEAQTSGVEVGLRGVHFIDANTGWAVGNGATIIHTTDGGATWTQQTCEVDIGFFNVYFADALHGWACGSGVVSTDDGGETWVDRGSHSAMFWGIHFTDASNGWIVGGGGEMHQTSDGGVTWTNMSIDIFEDFKAVYFTDTSTGWAAGGRSGGNKGIVYQTVDGGTSWVKQEIGTELDFEGMFFLNSAVGWAVGNYGAVLQTLDGGGTGVEDAVTPAQFELAQNSPNPFNPTTTISYYIPGHAHVTLDVFDVNGRYVKTLVNTHMSGGAHEAVWNGTDVNGKAVSSGLYMYRLRTGETSISRKMLLVR